jgi:hypothetical protein
MARTLPINGREKIWLIILPSPNLAGCGKTFEVHLVGLVYLVCFVA